MSQTKGRPPHNPTAELRASVRSLIAFGISEKDIATYHGMDAKTLRKHYREELDTGAISANAAVARNLFAIATSRDAKGNVAAAQFWLRMRAGWREYQVPTIPMDDEPKLGKKEAADIAARYPDVETDIGSLMARRSKAGVH